MSTTSARLPAASARKRSGASADPARHDRPLTALKERLQADLRTATLSQDVVRRDTLRLALSALHNEEVAKRGPLDEDAAVAVVARQAKMRRESIEAFAKGGRAELVAKERSELAVLESYLPAQVGEDDIRGAAQRAIAEVGTAGPAAQGAVMKKVMAELRGRADGKVVATIVTELLAKPK